MTRVAVMIHGEDRLSTRSDEFDVVGDTLPHDEVCVGMVGILVARDLWLPPVVWKFRVTLFVVGVTTIIVLPRDEPEERRP
jgi:hypothetical protein